MEKGSGSSGRQEHFKTVEMLTTIYPDIIIITLLLEGL